MIQLISPTPETHYDGAGTMISDMTLNAEPKVIDCNVGVWEYTKS